MVHYLSFKLFLKITRFVNEFNALCRCPFEAGSLIFLLVVFLCRWRAPKEPRGDARLRKPIAWGDTSHEAPGTDVWRAQTTCPWWWLERMTCILNEAQWSRWWLVEKASYRGFLGGSLERKRWKSYRKKGETEGGRKLWNVRKCPKFLVSVDSFFCKEYYIEYF